MRFKETRQKERKKERGNGGPKFNETVPCERSFTAHRRLCAFPENRWHSRGGAETPTETRNRFRRKHSWESFMIKELITVDTSYQVDDRLERARLPSISIKRSVRFRRWISWFLTLPSPTVISSRTAVCSKQQNFPTREFLHVSSSFFYLCREETRVYQLERCW